VVTLKLAVPATAKTLTYLVDRRWDPKTLLCGQNGIAALTFCEVRSLVITKVDAMNKTKKISSQETEKEANNGTVASPCWPPATPTTCPR